MCCCHSFVTYAGHNWLLTSMLFQVSYPWKVHDWLLNSLLISGFSLLKRWTKKVDLFAHDLILIPVHLGMHWCLAVVNLKVSFLSLSHFVLFWYSFWTAPRSSKFYLYPHTPTPTKNIFCTNVNFSH